MVRVRTLLTVFAYGIALLGCAPVFLSLDLLPRTLFLATLGTGVLFDRRQRYPLSGKWATFLSVVLFFWYALQVSRDNPALPVVNFLAILLGIRLVTEKTGRNFLQIYLLALFLLAGSSLLTLSAAFLGYLVALILLSAVSLVLLTFYGADPDLALSRRELRKLLTVTLGLPFLSLVLMLVFFMILPRTEYPLWDFLNAGTQKVTGLSERVAPGSAANVGEVRRTVIRVEMPRLSREELYWRGIVLNSFDGDDWVREESSGEEAPILQGGRAVRQTIYPEPGGSRYLVTLDAPRWLRGGRGKLAADLVFTTRELGQRRLRYEAESLVTDRLAVHIGPDPGFYLRLPDHPAPRLQELARQLARGARGDAEILARLKDFYLAQRLSYATSGLPTGGDSLERFLFQERRGHCELFASSFALLLRMAGVPARLVGGYYGGEYNKLGGYYIVTEDMAHVWVEAFLAGEGWVRVDPSGLAANFRAVSEGRGGRGVRWRVARLFDALSYFWNRAVITYDLEKQLRLFVRAGQGVRQLAFSARPAREHLRWLLLAAAIPLALVARRHFGATREERLRRILYARLRRVYGMEPPAGSGLLELAEKLGDPALREFAAVYYGAVFRDRRLTPDEVRRLRELTKRVGRRG